MGVKAKVVNGKQTDVEIERTANVKYSKQRATTSDPSPVTGEDHPRRAASSASKDTARPVVRLESCDTANDCR